MPTLPRESELVRALQARDASYDGVFFFGVRTTGVFCRPACPSRAPRLENVRFFRTAGEAVRAGFRACRRCRPLAEPGSHPHWVQSLLSEVERNVHAAGRRLSDADLAQRGVEPTNARRYFKERFGMTFQAYQRTLWLERAHGHLSAGGSATDVALDSGFGSESGFRAAFTRLFGSPPSRVTGGRWISVAALATPIGSLIAAALPDRVCMLDFPDRVSILAQTKSLRRWFDEPILPGTNAALEQLRGELAEYFAGKRRRFDVKLALAGTPFQLAVWNALTTIPYGETRSYEHIARAIGKPGANRAVGKANGDNRLAILLPCHRVVEKGGALRGYAGGLWRKQRLLDLERSNPTPG